MPLVERDGFWHFEIDWMGQRLTGTTGAPATAEQRQVAERFEAWMWQRLYNRQETLVPITFAEASQKFLEWARLEYSRRPASYKRFETSMVSLLKLFGGRLVHEIAARDLEQFKSERRLYGMKEVTVRHDLYTLSVFFRYAQLHRWADDNPVREVKVPSDADSIRIYVLSDVEERVYFEAAARNPTLHDLARVCLDHGLRPTEACHLRKEDYDPSTQHMQVQIGKSRAARRVLAVTPECQKILGSRLSTPGPWLFPGENPERPLSKFSNQHKRLFLITGQKYFPFYTFRHTFATRQARDGVSQTTLAAVLGHSTTRILTRYVHPSQREMDAAITRRHPGREVVEDADRQARREAMLKGLYEWWGKLPEGQRLMFLAGAMEEIQKRVEQRRQERLQGLLDETLITGYFAALSGQPASQYAP